MTVQKFLQDRTAIAGIGQTAFGKNLVQSEEALAAQAVKAALDDAGLHPSEVDGLCAYAMQNTDEGEIARNLGCGDVNFFARTPAGGGGGCALVGLAAMAVVSEQASVVVAWRSRKRSTRASRVWAQTEERVEGRTMWTAPHGLVRPVDEIAVLARRHMYEFGTSREHLATIALTIRAYANRNPLALMHAKKLTADAYFNARMISEPLGLYDCCLETDGAVAVVIVSAERARDLRQKPVYVHAAAQGLSAGSVMMSNYFNEDPLRTQAWACADALWRRSDIQPGDIQVAQIYDAFTPEILLSLEAYGFCGRGESGAFVADGNIALDGRLPLNTAGGSLSEVYLHGFNLVSEAVRQIRGNSTAQIPSAQTSFVCSSDGVPTSALVLRG